MAITSIFLTPFFHILGAILPKRISFFLVVFTIAYLKKSVFVL